LTPHPQTRGGVLRAQDRRHAWQEALHLLQGIPVVDANLGSCEFLSNVRSKSFTVETIENPKNLVRGRDEPQTRPLKMATIRELEQADLHFKRRRFYSC
jgi:hypothetical protein